MSHRPEVLLLDILEAGAAINMFVEGRTLADYGQDLMLRSAVERQFTIIGEALRRLERLDPDLVSHISEHRRIIDFRNIIAHGYEIVDDETVWQAIQDKLPTLLNETESLLAKLGEDKPEV